MSDRHIELRQALAQLGPRAKDVTALPSAQTPRGDTRPAVLRWLRNLNTAQR